ncbi:type IV secretion system protein [Phenylobacterium sp.]|uniref:type IV secretion system protein n=1 Tax=Phenylobacterium sp. TaxID=1871053 RepID=UPI00286C2C85|nr:type IV secretion system protein [Phenylobacterium sp.]
MPALCAAPQPDDGMVQGLLSSVDCNVQTMAEAGYNALAQPYSPMALALTAMLTLYIAFIGFRLLIGRTPLRVGDLTLSALKIGAVLVLATSWPTYQHLVFDTLFRGPEQLAAGMLDALQPAGSTLRGAAFAGLQAAYDELQLSAAFFTQHSLSVASPLQGGNAGAALALNASALMMLLTSLGVVLAAKIVLGLLLGLGPVFVAFLLFDATRGLFEGWLRAAVAFALAPLMAVLGLVVQLTLIEPHLLRLAEMRTGATLDVGPANAVFLLTLISTGVSVALAIAVGVIATGLRLPRPIQATAGTGILAQSSTSNITTLEQRSPAQFQLEPRAASVAAAAAAMDRRESRLVVAEGAAPRRIATGRHRDEARPAATSANVQASYRRPAQPRSAASNLRRDR